MSIQLNIADFKLKSKIPIPNEDIPIQRFPSFVQDSQEFSLGLTTQNANQNIGYILYKEALRVQIETYIATVLDDTTSFIVDAIINSNDIRQSNEDIYTPSVAQYQTNVSILVTQTVNNTPSDIATNQYDLSYFGLQVGTTPPTSEVGLIPYLGMYGSRVFTGVPVAETRNIVFALPNTKAPYANILLANLTDEFADYAKTSDAFVVGGVTYDVYVSNTAKPDTFNGSTLTLVP